MSSSIPCLYPARIKTAVLRANEFMVERLDCPWDRCSMLRMVPEPLANAT